jgi:hypothetical protein
MPGFWVGVPATFLVSVWENHRSRTLPARASGLPIGGAMLRPVQYGTALLGAAFGVILESALSQSPRQASDALGIVASLVFFTGLGWLIGLALAPVPSTNRLQAQQELRDAVRRRVAHPRAAPPAQPPIAGQPARQWQGW